MSSVSQCHHHYILFSSYPTTSSLVLVSGTYSLIKSKMYLPACSSRKMPRMENMVECWFWYRVETAILVGREVKFVVVLYDTTVETFRLSNIMDKLWEHLVSTKLETFFRNWFKDLWWTTVYLELPYGKKRAIVFHHDRMYVWIGSTHTQCWTLWVVIMMIIVITFGGRNYPLRKDLWTKVWEAELKSVANIKWQWHTLGIL